MEGSVPHASSRKRCDDLAGSVPLGQISNHSAAKDLITIQQALLRATPGRAGCLVGFLGPILPVRAPMAGDLTAHHRGATPNQVGDTRLGQARIHPRHNRRTILDSKHPTTPHDQPPNNITTTRKLLTPYDTAVVTNPCFELWLLWHTTDRRAYTETRDCVRLARSSRLIGDKDLTARFPIASFPEAVKRAQQAWPTIMPNKKGPNPSSAMPWLIDLMTPAPQKN